LILIIIQSLLTASNLVLFFRMAARLIDRMDVLDVLDGAGRVAVSP
jgi:hypothetical protein